MQAFSSPARAALAAALLAVLGACGGGGDDPPPTSSTPPTDGTPPPPGSTTPPPQATATCGHANFVGEVLQRVNEHRARGASCGSQSFGAAPALIWSNLLTQAATAHSQDMSANNFFSHTGSNGSTMAQRVNATGYGWSSLAENIAAGQTSIQSVVDGWMNSPGHCANIMSASYQHVGVACVPGTPTSGYRTYWTMNLGRPR